MCHVQRAELVLDRLLARSTFPCQLRTKACRSLFGPVDHEELGRDLEVRLQEIQEESCKRWGFNFQEGVPLSSTRFIWEETSGDTVPALYRDKDCTAQLSQGPSAQSEMDHIPRLDTNRVSKQGNHQKTALTMRTGSRKRSLYTGLITDFYPVRKKTKNAKTLCDKMCVGSPDPKEQTPLSPL